MNVTEFLKARIAEDEKIARDATQGPWKWYAPEYDRTLGTLETETYKDGSTGPTSSVVTAHGYDEPLVDISGGDACHIAAFNPARVLAEVQAKREAIAHYESMDWEAECSGHQEYAGRFILLMANVYADHPDYQDSWAV